MNFELTKQQQMIQELVREFAKKEVESIAAEIDLEGRFPKEQENYNFQIKSFGRKDF